VQWHPCLLAEITPHDGPAATGSHVWDYNNLAQKNISIVDAIPGSDFGMAMMMGSGSNDGDSLLLEVLRGKLSRDVELYLDLFELPLPPVVIGSSEWKLGERNGRRVVFLAPMPQVCVPIPVRAGRIAPVVVGGRVGIKAQVGVYEIRMLQRQPGGELSGAAVLSLTIGNRGAPA